MNDSSPLICVSICERTLSEAAQAVTRVANDADLIELRLDCLEDRNIQRLSETLGGFLEQVGTRVILTLRPDDQGGVKISTGDRIEFWELATELNVEFFDIEASLIPHFTLPADKWTRVIASHHDFEGAPSDLNKIYEKMKGLPARILKVAVKAEDVTDCLPVFELIDNARSEGRELIAIAMGQAGIPTRILGPSRGGFLTYGSVEEGSATAPGQITASELKNLYRLKEITRRTEIFGLVGRPTIHSLSPAIHNAAFAAAALNAVYLPFEVQHLDSFMKRMVNPRSKKIDWNLRGFSVTAPFKTEVMRYLDSTEPSAVEIGAVNTVTIAHDGMHGYNTDADALVKPLIATLGVPLRGLRCAVIGTGGAARTAAWVLSRERADVHLFGRDISKGQRLADEFHVSWSKLQNEEFSEFDVVINATPLGTTGPFENESAATGAQLRGAGLVYDLVYNPSETKLLREARSVGCRTLNGLQMLINQALAQYRLWTSQDANETVMRKAAENTLQSKKLL